MKFRRIGKKVVTMTHDEEIKTHPQGVSDVPSSEKIVEVYETSDENDGHKPLAFYMTKLNPQRNAFFQYSRKKWNYELSLVRAPTSRGRQQGRRYDDKDQSNSTTVQGIHQPQCPAYCNHLWSNAGVQNGHILVITISGHRKEQGLAHYNTWPSSDTAAPQLQRSALEKLFTGKFLISSYYRLSFVVQLSPLAML